MTMSLAASLDIDKFIQDVQARPAIWERSYHCYSLMQSSWTQLSKIHALPKVVLKTKWKGLRDHFRVEFKRIPRDENGELLMEADEYQSKWVHYEALLFLTEHMRLRAPKIESHDPYYFEVKPNSLSDYDDSYNMSDCLIQIPDDHPDESPKLSINGLAVNMGTLQVPSGATATVAEPILNETNSAKRFKKDDQQDDLEREFPDQSGTSSCPNGTSPVLGGMGDKSMDDDYHFLMSLHPYMTDLNLSQKLRVRMKIQKLVFNEMYKDDDVK